MPQNVSYEGINFGDIFINNKTLFINLFTQYYKQNSKNIEMAINQLYTLLSKGEMKSAALVTEATANAFNEKWQTFRSTVLLLTQPQQLLVLYRGAKGAVEQISDIVDQSAVMGSGQQSLNQAQTTYGIKSGDLYSKELKTAAKANKVEQFLQKHIEDFANYLEKPITKSEAHKLHAYHSRMLLPKYQKGEEHLTGELWRRPFYGDSNGQYYSGRGLGQVYDAFMNHIANYQTALYKALSKGTVEGISTNLLQVHKTVVEEEGGVNKASNFPRLLHESKNNISWYSGGDIIIVDKNSMAVAYNIQLKSTGKNIQSIFGVRVAQLRAFIEKLYATNTPEQKAEILYQNLLTTISNRRDFDQTPQKTIDTIVKEQFVNKFSNLTFTFS